MSVNKYMHPRNIYRKPPDFKQMAIDFPEFRKFIKQDIVGKVSIDFKNAEALRALTCTLLKKDFDLDVEIPVDKMIPTIPLRLNYILWIEDLLGIFGSAGEQISGIDIGTGASSVYCLLGAKSKGWHMTGTEVDDVSIQYARANIDRNRLCDLINVKKMEVESQLLLGVVDQSKTYDFCMCNPPFFASSEELNPSHRARRLDRPKPKNAFCASVSEVIVSGGEVSFVTKLINESCQLKKVVKIYTTMVGHKSSLPPLKKLLRDTIVASFKQSEFYQGNTVRWALAWTFHDNVDLRTIPEDTVIAARKSKLKPPLTHTIKSELASLTSFDEKLTKIFADLQMHVENTKRSKNVKGYCLTAVSNTWSHQRTKRRAQQRLNSVLDSSVSGIENTAEMVAQLTVASSPSKRVLEEYNDEDEERKQKKLKPGELENNNCYLKCIFVVRKEKCQITIELSYVEGSAGRDGLQQVMQYVKNHIDLC